MEEWKEVADLKEKCQNALKSIGQGHEAALLIQQQQMSKAQRLRDQLEQNRHIEVKRWRAAVQEEKLRRRQYEELARIAKKRLKVRKSTACWERSLARIAALSIGMGRKEPEKSHFGHRERIVLPDPGDYRHTFLHSSLLVCKDEKRAWPNHREPDAWEAADLQRVIMEQCRLVQKEIKNVTNKRQALRGKAALSRTLINQRIHALEEQLLTISQIQHENQGQLSFNKTDNFEHKDISSEALTGNKQHVATSLLNVTSSEDGHSTEMNLTRQSCRNRETVNLTETNDDHGNDCPEIDNVLQEEICLPQREAERNGLDSRHLTVHTINKSRAHVPDAGRKIRKRPLTVSKASRNDSRQIPPVVQQSNDITKSTKAEDVFLKKTKIDVNFTDTKLGRFAVNNMVPKNDLEIERKELQAAQLEPGKNHRHIFSGTKGNDSEHVKQQQRQGKAFKHLRKTEQRGFVGKSHFGTTCFGLPKERLENKHLHQQSGSVLDQSTLKPESFDYLKKESHVSVTESAKCIATKLGGLEPVELPINQVEECKPETRKSCMGHRPLIKTKALVGVQKNVGNVKVKKKMKLKMKDDYFRMLFKQQNTCKKDRMHISNNPDQATLNAGIMAKSDNAVNGKMLVAMDNDFNKPMIGTLSPSPGGLNGSSDKMSLGAANTSLQRVCLSRCQSRLQNPVYKKDKQHKSKGAAVKVFGKSNIVSNSQPQMCNAKLGLDGIHTPLQRKSVTKKSKCCLSLKAKSGQVCGQHETTGCIDFDTHVTALGNETPGLKDDSKDGLGSTELCVSEDMKKSKASIFHEESSCVHHNNDTNIGEEPAIATGDCNAQTTTTCDLSLVSMEKNEVFGSDEMSLLQKEGSLSIPRSRGLKGIASRALYEDKISSQDIGKECAGQRRKMMTAHIVAKKLIDYMERNHSKQTSKNNLQCASSNSVERLKADFKLKLNQILKLRNAENAAHSVLNGTDLKLDPLDTGNILLQTKSLPKLGSQDLDALQIPPNDSRSLEEQLKVDCKEQITEIIESINVEHTDNNIVTIIRQILGSSDRAIFDLSKISWPRAELGDLEVQKTKKDETEIVGENISRPQGKLIASFLASLCAGVSQLDASLGKRRSSDLSLRSSVDDQRSEPQSTSANGNKIHDHDGMISNSLPEHDNTTNNQCLKLNPYKTILEISTNSVPVVSEMHKESRMELSQERPPDPLEGKDCLACKQPGTSCSDMSADSGQSELNENLLHASDHMQSTSDMSGTSENPDGNADFKMSRDFTVQNDDFTIFGGQSAGYRMNHEDGCLSCSSISSMDISYSSLQNKNKGNVIAETHCRTEGRLQPRVLFPVDQLNEEECISANSASLRSSASLSSADLHEAIDNRSSIDMQNDARKRYNKKELAQRLVLSYAESTDSLDSYTGNSSFEDWPCRVIPVQQVDPTNKLSSNDPKPSVSDQDISLLQVHLGPDSSCHSGFDSVSQSYRRCSRELNVDKMDVFPRTLQDPIQNDKCMQMKSETHMGIAENTSNWRSSLLVDSNELINLEEEEGYCIELSPWSMDGFVGMSPRKQIEYDKERDEHKHASQLKEGNSTNSVLDKANRCSSHQNDLKLNSCHSSSKKVEVQRQRNNSARSCQQVHKIAF